MDTNPVLLLATNKTTLQIKLRDTGVSLFKSQIISTMEAFVKITLTVEITPTETLPNNTVSYPTV